ncbi:unnamed protein product [Miscanthus lutarioriparius]|uniref:Uncharacterized protein n=1 Tax=Miscanthus lutarioriparius TaxID=422564 RepID=A0A811N7J2_9POAL|nr:unnamed protein product [Miscanthus lutarioriparius]
MSWRFEVPLYYCSIATWFVDKAAAATAALLLKGDKSPPAAGFGIGSGFALAISLLSEEGLGPAGWALRTHWRAASPLRRTRAVRLSPPGISTNTWWVFLFISKRQRPGPSPGLLLSGGGARAPAVRLAAVKAPARAWLAAAAKSARARPAAVEPARARPEVAPDRRRRSSHVPDQRPRPPWRGGEGRGHDVSGHPGACWGLGHGRSYQKVQGSQRERERSVRDLRQGALIVPGGHCSSGAATSGGSVVPNIERGSATPARATGTLTGDGRGSARRQHLRDGASTLRHGGQAVEPARQRHGADAGAAERTVALGFGQGRCEVRCRRHLRRGVHSLRCGPAAARRRRVGQAWAQARDPARLLEGAGGGWQKLRVTAEEG